MSKEKLQKIILFVLILAGVSYAVYKYYISISNENIQKYSLEYNEKNKKVKNLERWSKKREEAERKIEAYESELIKVEELLPSKSQGSEITMDIYKMIKSSTIKTDNVDLSFPKENEKYAITRVSINTSGSLDEIKEVLNYFKGFKKKLIVKNFSVQATPQNYTAKIDFDLYSMKE
ncbi:MAG: type 4a pilus biogenesis protein PilO [Deltaproteobacteria bacterium]